MSEPGPALCDECNREVYADLVILCEAWVQISPTGDLGGFLCPTCIVERLAQRGIRTPCALYAAGLDAVSGHEMEALRRVENIELALSGYKNRWGAELDARIREGRSLDGAAAKE